MMKARNTFIVVMFVLMLGMESAQLALLINLDKEEKTPNSRQAQIMTIDRKEFLQLWQKEGRRLFYFRSESCAACQESDLDVTAYLEKGYGNYLPLYVIEDDLDSYADLIKVTPSLILKEGEEMIRKEGAEEVFLLLDEIVHETD